MGNVTRLPSATEGRISAPTALSANHRVENFRCGHEALDDWLRKNAQRSEGKSARTYAVSLNHEVIGYYCLSTGAVKRDSVPRKQRHGLPDPTPVMIIGRMAVDERYHGQGIGGGLLKDALSRIVEASNIVGFRAVLVHAIDDKAMSFYTGYGFKEFPSGTRTMFLPTETIIEAVRG